MRIPKSWIPVLAKEISHELLSKDFLELNMTEEHFKALLEELILEEMMVEDTLNEEVREMLKKFDSEIEKGNMDYRRLFELTKKKLVKDRNIVI